MKLTGFLLLTTGWGILVSAIVLLPLSPIRGLFVFVALLVEVLGLALVLRSHIRDYRDQVRDYRDQE